MRNLKEGSWQSVQSSGIAYRQGHGGRDPNYFQMEIYKLIEGTCDMMKRSCVRI